MAANSAIEWTDATFNAWEGCAKVAAGCKNCYAETRAHRFGKVQWGPAGSRMLRSESYWSQPVKWNAEAAAEGVRRRVFCSSLADVFEDFNGRVIDHQGKPSELTLDDVRERLFDLIDATPWLDWLLLTKRPENIRRFWPIGYLQTDEDGPTPLHIRGPRDPIDHRGWGHARPNVWLLTSVAEQKDAEKNIPELLKCRDLSPVLGLSIEPLIEAVDLTLTRGVCDGSETGGPPGCGQPVRRNVLSGWESCGCCDEGCEPTSDKIDWVIVGGESGPGARPMHPDWARGLRDQCAAAGVPFFFKQWGEWIPAKREEDGSLVTVSNAVGSKSPRNPERHTRDDGTVSLKVGKKAAGRLLDGVTHDAMPTASTRCDSQDSLAGRA